MERTCRRLAVAGQLFLILIVCPACGGNNRLGRLAVSGSIQLDGAPLNDGSISFEPYQHAGVAAGDVVAGGEYEIDAEKGLPPGKYLVRIYSPVDVNPADEEQEISVPGPTIADTGPRQPPPGRERIPPAYNTNSEQVIEVTAAGPNRFDFDIKTP